MKVVRRSVLRHTPSLAGDTRYEIVGATREGDRLNAFSTCRQSPPMAAPERAARRGCGLARCPCDAGTYVGLSAASASRGSTGVA